MHSSTVTRNARSQGVASRTPTPGITSMNWLGDLDEVHGGVLDAGSPKGSVVWTPLQFACASGKQLEATQLLQSQPQLLNAMGKTKYLASPVAIAVRYGHTDVVHNLLEQGADVNAKDEDTGISPLAIAIMQQNAEIVKLLLKRRPTMTTMQNETTLLELARHFGDNAIVEWIQEATTMEEKIKQVREWLASIGLSGHLEAFINAGFDDLPFLLHSGLNDASLDAMKITKPGHRLKLQNLYKLKVFLEEEDGEEEESDESDEESSGEEESGSSEEESEDSDDK